MNETYDRCDSCGNAFERGRLTEFDGHQLCLDCLIRTTVICSHCGTRIWRDENAGDDTTPLCQPCCDHWYLSCARCGRIIHEDDAYYRPGDDDEPCCHDCYMRERGHKTIRDYYFKPEPLFRGDGPRWFGVELEIDGAGEDPDNAGELLAIANSNGLENLYIKYDGSLDDGLELVTHPMSLDYHLHEMPWADILRRAAALGYTSHQARICGLHIHVSRAALGDTEAAQDAVIARILYFFEKTGKSC